MLLESVVVASPKMVISGTWPKDMEILSDKEAKSVRLGWCQKVPSGGDKTNNLQWLVGQQSIQEQARQQAEGSKGGTMAH